MYFYIYNLYSLCLQRCLGRWIKVLCFPFMTSHHIQYMYIHQHGHLISNSIHSQQFSRKSSTTKIPKNVIAVVILWVPKSYVIQNLHPGRSGKAKGSFFVSFFLWDVHPEGKAKRHTGWRGDVERQERYKSLEVHSFLWGAAPAKRWMRSFRESEQAKMG